MTDIAGYVIEERKPPRFSFQKTKPAMSDDDMSEFEITVEPVYSADTVQALQDYIVGLERALSEYVILGAGKCTISKAHAEMGRAALAAKP